MKKLYFIALALAFSFPVNANNETLTVNHKECSAVFYGIPWNVEGGATIEHCSSDTLIIKYNRGELRIHSVDDSLKKWQYISGLDPRFNETFVRGE